ncbi:MULTISPECIES: hypothetical protein [unclassified Pseudomonas]|uniref:hypothetical protein n=1 Tax=unclassified Pseudomonas TaxID=196821 RepID=UPI00244D3D6E|nr:MULTISPECIES: hypothetical protein [unclassified Pseudomonas]MDG9928504.1 hypothetical protein [Pseudomonas sp. GD04042]MDH0482674.1 hypothetical protein [Pseudomonas sp. GD04015]MDH0604624.1 hypothetical protein [Pseudomonas sp. GD03869]
MKATDTGEFINSLNAGVFSQQVGRALSDVAAGVVEFGKKGKVVITLELSQIGESNQVKINHKLDFAQPTKRGSKREDTALDTPMYVTANGLELFQSDPTAQLFKQSEAPVIPRD